jgi:hypothetical protein
VEVLFSCYCQGLGDEFQLGHQLHTIMDSEPLLYSTGEEVHAGDRVQYQGTYATVVFVSDGEVEEISPGYEDYTGASRGIVLLDDDGMTSEIGDPDERLSFVDRG